MRRLTTLELKKFEKLTNYSINFSIIEITETGIKKSIMDATGPVRKYLLDEKIHNYELQKQGTRNRVFIKSYLISDTSTEISKASLYRPETKKGDPRIWFYNLKKIVKPNDILGIISYDGELIVINLTQVNIEILLNGKKQNKLNELIDKISIEANSPVQELLSKFREIKKMGPVLASVDADTAVGRTLETLLGIKINSSKEPDYKGIELKSFRLKKNLSRKTLFAKVPNWELSKLKSSEQILNAFGYEREDNFKLNCTVSSVNINSQGLYLEVDNINSLLLENSNDKEIGNFVVWNLDDLHNKLLEKHSETFWVSAESLIIDGKEHFIYKSIEHTKKPMLPQFDILLEQGIITVDHLIKRNLKGRVVERGPLFKIKPKCLNLLFPPSNIYDIS